MTANQLTYWANQERIRDNMYNEQETTRHNKITENQGQFSILESARHNRATELLTGDSINESIRHNTQSEAIGFGNLRETSAHNVATEKQAKLNLAEQYASLNNQMLMKQGDWTVSQRGQDMQMQTSIVRDIFGLGKLIK